MLLGIAVPVPGQEQGWEKRWNKTLAAAKKEAKVVVRAPADPAVRRNLPAAFTARFGIPIDYISGRSSEMAAKFRIERRAGLYSVDVILSGMGTMANVVYREKMLDPLKPALILPEVMDPSKWKKGKLWFMDPDRLYILRLFNYVSTPNISINTRYAKPEEFRSVRDLLRRKWQRKIAIIDPTTAGPGLGSIAPMYLQLGEEFVRKLLIGQKPIFSRKRRQLADWLAQGNYPITIGLSSSYVKQLQGEGFPVVSMYNLPDMPDKVGAGNVLGLVNRAPHPNAARVFVNWIASKEGLEVFSRARRLPTTRSDIDESFLLAEENPRRDYNYFDGSGWEYIVTERDKVRRRLKEMLRR